MPLLKKEIYTPSAAPSTNQLAMCSEVFVLPPHNEIFLSYEDYVDRMILYKQKIWSCRYTGKTGLSYEQASESERRSAVALTNFPDAWKPVALAFIQHSTLSANQVAARIMEELKLRYVVGERIKFEVEGQHFIGRIAAASELAAENGFMASEREYHLEILDMKDGGRVIGEAKIFGDASFTREKSLFNRTMFKRFVRDVATRGSYSGSPWILRADIAAKYGLDWELPPELATLQKEHQKLKTMPTLQAESIGKAPEPEPFEGLVFPMEDLELPEDMQGTVLWPEPLADLPFSPTVVPMVLQCWSFLHAFSEPLKLSRFSYDDFEDALTHQQLPNPLLEAIHNALLLPLRKDRRSQSKAAFVEMFGKALLALFHDQKPIANGVSASLAAMDDRKRADNSMDDVIIDENNQELESIGEVSVVASSSAPIHPDLEKFRWYESRSAESWHVVVTGFLVDTGKMIENPRLTKILAQLSEENLEPGEDYPTLPADDKLILIALLIEMVIQFDFVKRFVDNSVEQAGELKKILRETEHERNRIAREIKEAESVISKEREELEATPNIEPPDRKAIERKLRTRETAIKKQKQNEAAVVDAILQLEQQLAELSPVQCQCLGQDRDYRRYWWFDSDGSAEEDGCGRLFVEEPLSWRYYDEAAKIEALLEYLNPLGNREAKLKVNMEACYDRIASSLRKRPNPILANVPEESVQPRRRGRPARNSARQAPSFMKYRNKLAV